ncbi:c6 zinc finger protein [Moniliophthora roreri MCA 2997]|uniref:C6 zinc finger protein n=2 Tax=Moniliophthora roreri TaxID=221103 RepID=V2Y1X9_MONRO|nr:c6 zinc finger protein [Moniliophthora roreri MCA 2997]
MSTRSATTFEGVIRFHTKSKNGCLTCRRRRIKCDEAEPICRNCHRRELVCVQRPKIERKQQESTLYKPLTTPLPSSFTIDATSLQVFHHYMTVTAPSLCTDPIYVAASTSPLPRLLFSNPVCMHATLAFTALHLGRLYELSSSPSSQNWVARASAHRKAAIGLFLSPSLNPDVHFMTIRSLLFYTVSSSLSSPSSSPESIFSLVTLLHNVWSPLKQFIYADPWLKDVSCHFRRLVSAAALTTHDLSTRFLAPLHHLYDDTLTNLDLDREELDDSDIKEAYRMAVFGLIATYPLTQTGLEARSLVFWPALFGKRFVELLNERRQRALIILYYYLMILRNLSERFWWVSEVGRWVDYVYGLIDERWREWLRKVIAENAWV